MWPPASVWVNIIKTKRVQGGKIYSVWHREDKQSPTANIIIAKAIREVVIYVLAEFVR